MASSLRHRITSILFQPIDASTLATFRVLFGIIMLWVTIDHWSDIEIAFLLTDFHFTYDFFHWVKPLPGNGQYIHFTIMGIAALFITLGLFYRISMTVFAFCFLYFFLLEQAIYLNHYYFISLLSFLLIFVRANATFSLDNILFKKTSSKTVPFWNILIFRAQIFIVYFYAGLAKINYDWLRCEPLKEWFFLRADYFVGPLIAHDWVACMFSYGGLFFDLSIGFLLFYRRTRILAYIGILGFNLTNAVIFNIGVFPWTMLAITVVFFDPDTPRKFFNKIFRKSTESKDDTSSTLGQHSETYRPNRFVVSALSIYFCFQLLFPFRHLLYPGNVSWTTEGHNFSWRMKLNEKQGIVMIYAEDPKTGKKQTVNPQQFLLTHQYRKLKSRPHMIYQYAQYIKEQMTKAGVENPIIRVEARLALNGRPLSTLVAPGVNFADVEYSPLRHSEWIEPLPEDLKIGQYIRKVGKYHMYEYKPK